MLLLTLENDSLWPHKSIEPESLDELLTLDLNPDESDREKESDFLVVQSESDELDIKRRNVFRSLCLLSAWNIEQMTFKEVVGLHPTEANMSRKTHLNRQWIICDARLSTTWRPRSTLVSYSILK